MVENQKKKIEEIRIRKVEKLSSEARSEVAEKLKKIRADNTEFDFVGFARVFYAEASPLEVVDVEPIEGTIIDELKRLAETLKETN